MGGSEAVETRGGAGEERDVIRLIGRMARRKNECWRCILNVVKTNVGVIPLRWRLAAGSIYSTGEVVGPEASETGGRRGEGSSKTNQNRKRKVKGRSEYRR